MGVAKAIKPNSDRWESEDRFEPVPLDAELHRDSLAQDNISISYWQGTWYKLRRNTKALFSLYFIAAMLLLTLIGPVLWSVDPAAQDLIQLSQPPGLAKHAVIVEPFSRWPGPSLDQKMKLADQSISQAPSLLNDNPLGLDVIDTVTTEFVRLVWSGHPKAVEYRLYRNEYPPQDLATLGIPLAEVEPNVDPSAVGPQNVLGYEDRFKLSERSYYYSVVAVDDSGDIFKPLVYSVIAVKPVLGVTLADVEYLDLKSNSGTREVGDSVVLDWHPFGTDALGRDILARLIYGARTSLLIGILAPLIYIALGVLYGGFAGYVGGKIDEFMMRFADFVIALPFLLFMILLKVAFGVGPGESGIYPMIVALILLGWPSAARLVRGQTFVIREQAYVKAAQLMGGRPLYIVMRHVLPNVMPIIIVSLTFAVPATIFTEAFLSFIGFGVVPPNPSWGSMCNDGLQTMLAHPHELIFPAVAISMTVLCFNLLGDGLREAMDVKYKD